MPAPSMPARRIHLTAPAAPARKIVQSLGVSNAKGLIRFVTDAIDARYAVTTDDPTLLLACEDEHQGGRDDDDARIAQLNGILADDDVAALVSLRGGAWFSRLVDRIDWPALDRRTSPLAIFGFSELTTLVAIAGRHRQVIGVHDLGPGFLETSLRRWAQHHPQDLDLTPALAAEQQDKRINAWVADRYPIECGAFFREVADLLDGQSSPRVPRGRLLAGTLPSHSTIRVTGGNLSVLMPMLGSRFVEAIETAGKWLLIEEVNESIEKIDRMLAGLKLAGLIDRAAGILLGDMHDGDNDLNDAAFACLQRHRPADTQQPVVRLLNVGHIHPMAPLVVHRDVSLNCHASERPGGDIAIEMPWSSWLGPTP